MTRAAIPYVATRRNYDLALPVIGVHRKSTCTDPLDIELTSFTLVTSHTGLATHWPYVTSRYPFSITAMASITQSEDYLSRLRYLVDCDKTLESSQQQPVPTTEQKHLEM